MVAERGTHFVFVIAIAGYDIKRRLERRQQFAQSSVLLRTAMLDRIARENHGIGLLLIDIRDAAPQTVSPQFGGGLIRFRRQNMRIADLGNEQ